MEFSKPRQRQQHLLPTRRSNGGLQLHLWPAHASLLLAVLLAMSTAQSCLGLPLEATTIAADLDETTTAVAPQQSASAATAPTAAVAANETLVKTSDAIEADETAAEIVGNSFVALGEGLEEGIRNAVKSEVQSEIEAASAPLVEPLKEDQSQPEGDAAVNDNEPGTEQQEIAATNVREPKTLEAEANPVQIKETAGVVVNDETTPSVGVEANQEETVTEDSEPEAESRSKPLPSGETSDLISVIFDENRAITEQPITKTNLLALEQELESFRKETTPAPTYEVTRHQVTKKQGVEDLLPIEVTVLEPEVPDIVEYGDNREMRNLEQAAKDSESSNNLEEIHENAIDTDAGEQKPAIATIPLESVQSSEESNRTTIIKDNVAQEKDDIYVAKDEDLVVTENENVFEPKKEDDAIQEPEGVVLPVKREPVEDAEPAEDLKPLESDTAPQAVPIDSSTTARTTTTEAATTLVAPVAAHAEPEPAKETQKSNESTEQPAAGPVYDEAYEEIEQPSGDEPKAHSEDSTATPLVSYPPHDAEQTFNDNLADERTAHLSLASSNRSTLIIALCSGTAVLFIVISLVIFVVSFQRQHGTLDIEMQEQRLGKDDLDEEDAQMKLLDVELSAPAAANVTSGNEETDECL